MKLVLLVDNNTFIDKYCLGEPGFCAYVEDGETRLLLDLGYSGIFIENARRMNVDLSNLDYIAISHGHLDHTWGLGSLIRHYAEMEFEEKKYKKPVILGHPETFIGISDEGCTEIGSLIPEGKLRKFFKLNLRKEPQSITERLTYLGEIPRENVFEGKRSFGVKDGKCERDSVPDDSALAYKAKDGLVIITGCSHSGICNIVEYAKKVTGENRILDIIGGLHLLNPLEEQLKGTIEYFKYQSIRKMHPCHCTDLKSKIRLSAVVAIDESGSGLVLDY